MGTDLLSVPSSREEAEQADRLDPLAGYRPGFQVDPQGPIYLDGNSLGRPNARVTAAIEQCLSEWRRELVGAWDHWADLPRVVGDRTGELIGSAPGQVVVSDSTTVNLYKLACAALDVQARRTVIVADPEDFPTVRYVLQGLADREGRSLRWLPPRPEGVPTADFVATLGDDVALVCLSAVNYRSGAVVDMAAVNEVAHAHGALVLWDLSHAAGAIPLALDSCGADLAVGCGYKYLNGGPGAPSFLYVSSRLVAQLRQPIWGWWGQAEQFEMGPVYEPVAGPERYLTGTPAVLGVVALGAAVEVLLEAGMPALWGKSQRLIALLAERCETRLRPLGARVASPGAARRGAHLAVSHPQAWPAARMLIERGLVVPDFRPPDVLRLAPVPIYTSFTEVWDAVERVAGVLDGPVDSYDPPKRRVT